MDTEKLELLQEAEDCQSKKGRTMKDETKKKLSIIAKSKKIIRDAKGRILTIEKEV